MSASVAQGDGGGGGGGDGGSEDPSRPPLRPIRIGFQGVRGRKPNREAGEAGKAVDWGPMACCFITVTTKLSGVTLSARSLGSSRCTTLLAQNRGGEEGGGLGKANGCVMWQASNLDLSRTSSRKSGISILTIGLTLSKLPEAFKMLKTRQRARSSAGSDPGHLLSSKTSKWRAPRLESANIDDGVPYIEDQIMAMVRKGKQRGHIPVVGRVLAGQGRDAISINEPRCTHTDAEVVTVNDDHVSEMLTQLESQHEVCGGRGSGGGGDDEPARRVYILVYYMENAYYAGVTPKFPPRRRRTLSPGNSQYLLHMDSSPDEILKEIPYVIRLYKDGRVVKLGGGNVVPAVSVDYRTAPEHPVPICFDDSWEAVKWVAQHVNGNGPDYVAANDIPDFSHVFFAGDSAGGNITHHMAIRVGSENQGRVSGESLNLEAHPGTSGSDDPLINPDKDPKVSDLGCSRVLVCVAGKDILKDRGIYYKFVLGKNGWKGDIENMVGGGGLGPGGREVGGGWVVGWGFGVGKGSRRGSPGYGVAMGVGFLGVKEIKVIFGGQRAWVVYLEFLKWCGGTAGLGDGEWGASVEVLSSGIVWGERLGGDEGIGMERGFVTAKGRESCNSVKEKGPSMDDDPNVGNGGEASGSVTSNVADSPSLAVGNGVEVHVPKESSTSGKFGLVKSMMIKDMHFFKFGSKEGMEVMLESSPWLIHYVLLILKQWTPDANITKEDVCRASYGRAMIELKVDVHLRDTIIVDVPKFSDEGFTTSTIHVEYEWAPLRCLECKNSKMPCQRSRAPLVGLKPKSTFMYRSISTKKRQRLMEFKGAYAIISSEESHRKVVSGSTRRNHNYAFASRVNEKGNAVRLVNQFATQVVN
ncbi:probable carboxylesterase 12 [Tanacetum coccineum]